MTSPAQRIADLRRQGYLPRDESVAYVTDRLAKPGSSDHARVLHAQVTGGLAVDVLPARGLDLGAASVAGLPLAWTSPVADARTLDRAVETGACPHTAIRDDVTMNLLAVEDLERDFDPLDLVLVESGGDNLTATFAPSLVDAQLFVLDVAGGGDVARKGGPGIGRADLLVINKIDLAEHVDVDVEQMLADATDAR